MSTHSFISPSKENSDYCGSQNGPVVRILKRIQCRKECQEELKWEKMVGVSCNTPKRPVDGEPLAYFT